MKAFIAAFIIIFAVFCSPLPVVAKGIIIIGGLSLMGLVYLWALASAERKSEGGE